MTPGVPCLHEEDGAWIVSVLVDGKLQQYRCAAREHAQRFLQLFAKPPRKERRRAPRKASRATLPRVRVVALGWG